MKRLFPLYALTFLLFLAAAGAPSPLYRVYQAELHFSDITLTAIFAVYAVALLISLLFLGSLSDFTGRRPVLFAALILGVSGMLLFAVASSVAWLIAARTVQGVATGIATAVLSAGLFDSQPRERQGLAPLVSSIVPLIGLGIGAISAAFLLVYAPLPTVLVYILFLLCFLVAGGAFLYAPETAEGKRGWRGSLKPSIAVPPGAKAAFVIATPSLVAGWALGGLYLSLGPSVASSIMRSSNYLTGGLIILLLTGASALSSTLLRGQRDERLLFVGIPVSSFGLSVTAVSIITPDILLFLLGTTISGLGLGSTFTGAFRTVMQRSTGEGRAGLASAVYIVSYLAFGIPAVIAGIAAVIQGLTRTFLLYDYAVISLFLATLVLSRFVRTGSVGTVPPS